MIPQYLEEIAEAPYYYGELFYDEKKNAWIIKGEPCVIDIAKRLFPGCESRDRETARFQNNKRINGDLNWLMMRYPLTIIDREKWREDHQKTVAHVLKRQEIQKMPIKAEPPPTFKMPLKEFQQEGLAFLLHNRRALLADEMGLGKTATSLAFLTSTAAWPALIVVPPHLRKGWMKEMRFFLNLPIPDGEAFDLFDDERKIPVYCHLIEGLRPYELPKNKSIYLIHYLLLRGWKNELPNFGFKTVIFDEIQELRHRQTEKYSSASLVADSCENVIGLSGTPIHNRGGEMWNVMNIIDFHCLSDYESFTRNWCYGYGSDVVVNPDLLGDHLKREGLLLRRTKDVVLKELPPKRRVVQPIDVDSGRYGEMIQEAIEKAHMIDDIKDILERGRLTRDIMRSARHAMGVSKAPQVCAFVKMLLDAGEKVLLFAYHHDVFDIYMKELREYRPVKISGAETSEQKDQAVRAFMDEEETSIVCLSLRTAAGLNLQKATCVVFGELDWSPAVHAQCEDRAHRIGQHNSILCYYLVCEEGTDEAIQDALGLKISQFVGLMGDKVESQEDRAIAQTVATEHMRSVIDKLKSIKITARRKAV